MASKRIAQSTINWASISERVPSEQRSLYIAFKAKADAYLRKVVSFPEQPPKIDWALYKSKVPVPGMVDEFKKKYESFIIPLPSDSQVLSEIAALEKQAAANIQKFKQESAARISSYEVDLKKYDNQTPIADMTLEEFAYAYPEHALDPINNPTFWPHTEEQKLGPEDLEPAKSSH